MKDRRNAPYFLKEGPDGGDRGINTYYHGRDILHYAPTKHTETKMPPSDFTVAARYAVTPEAFLNTWKLGQWNTLRIRVTGQLPWIVTWLNGGKLFDFDSASYDHPRCDRAEVARVVPRRGHIALQIHGGTERWTQGDKCRWRNIEFRPIAAG